jgi:hypothetical protein
MVAIMSSDSIERLPTCVGMPENAFVLRRLLSVIDGVLFIVGFFIVGFFCVYN